MFQHTRRARSKYDTTGGAQYEDINAMAYEGSSYVRTCWFLKQEKNSALVFFTIFYLWKEKFNLQRVLLFFALTLFGTFLISTTKLIT